MSPYLLYGNLLLKNEIKVQLKNWKPIKIANGGSEISHLFFADDIVLMTRANEINCTKLEEVLNDFFSQSGQTINTGNQRLYFSKIALLESKRNSRPSLIL